MSIPTNTLNGLDIDEISGVLIKEELIKVVKNQLGCSEVQLCIEHGSKKGTQ